ncbi:MULTISPECIES: DinB family protein [unclassified Streptomyces]|uniref:DinB family protein n=1 Tax=unclassified Streptomyces TaxID=2593676 RepID=UPI0016615300|nr:MULTISPECIES: DinB family protein [unclassified Streptomyces]MBD0707559.1 Mini-circle protein [Streptomyces sp. CBMA291]MBD0718009.1 Mini-circle protein [Streptomyces sp. CBMA370]
MTTERVASVPRVDPATTTGEREALEQWLDYHRATLASKCEGLTDAQLRTPSAPPSDLNLLGLVRHMAEVERGWFRKALADEPAPWLYSTDEDIDRDIHATDEDTYEEAFATWQKEIAHARSLAAARELDDVAAGRTRNGRPINLRWIYLHMIEEYARHNGHADLLRERVDGVTGD